MINQNQMLRQFNERNREEFNPELFELSDDKIIRELESIILSCQRSRTFRIRVINFSVVDHYDEINRLLREYEKNNLNRSKSTENKYDYIQLKDTDIRLLIVDYFIEVYNTTVESERSKVLRVYIQIPRVVNKYYFKIGGNFYMPMSQVIESTYNNSFNKNTDVGMNAYKTMFMASRIFRFRISDTNDKLKMPTVSGEVMKGVYFSSIIFSKSVHIMKYLLARFGIYRTMEMLQCPFIDFHQTQPNLDEKDFYIIQAKNVYISVPRYIYDNDMVTQSLVYTIYIDIDNEATFETIFSREYWLDKLGRSFGTKMNSINKGYSVLESLESICDDASMRHLRLAPEHKRDIYDIIVWVCRQFSELRMKDNLDISMKRWRREEYFVCLYAHRLIRGVYSIADKGNKITLQTIERSLNIDPDFLVKAIAKDKLANPFNMANDLDSIATLKYTYKGVSGLGEDGTSIPLGYKQVHESHIGRVDLDSSSNSDPGMTGTLCPISDMHNGWFSDTPEPDDWREKIEDLHSKYRELNGLKSVLLFKKELGVQDEDSRIESIDESLQVVKRLYNPLSSLDKHLYGNQLFSEVLWDEPCTR